MLKAVIQFVWTLEMNPSVSNQNHVGITQSTRQRHQNDLLEYMGDTIWRKAGERCQGEYRKLPTFCSVEIVVIFTTVPKLRKIDNANSKFRKWTGHVVPKMCSSTRQLIKLHSTTMAVVAVVGSRLLRQCC